MICQCGHGFDHHFTMAPILGLPGPRSSRCMQCECTERVERPEQADIFGTEAS